MTVEDEGQDRIIGVTREQAKVIEEARTEQRTQNLNADEEEALRMALEALDRKVDLSQAQISRQRVHAVEWPDSSLGCPQAGQSYLQVITPGYLVSLVADGKSYAIHVGAGTAVVCDKLTADIEERRKKSQQIMKVYRAAQADLASRLKIDPREIKITGMTPTTWDDSNLGCPTTENDGNGTPVDGFVIKMECRGRQYEYHSDNEGDVFVSCDELESCYETE